jgi:hypothetical protein
MRSVEECAGQAGVLPACCICFTGLKMGAVCSSETSVDVKRVVNYTASHPR